MIHSKKFLQRENIFHAKMDWLAILITLNFWLFIYEYYPYREYDFEHPDFGQECKSLFKKGDRGCVLGGDCPCKPLDFTILYGYLNFVTKLASLSAHLTMLVVIFISKIEKNFKNLTIKIF
jgi:hypothetical protein